MSKSKKIKVELPVQRRSIIALLKRHVLDVKYKKKDGSTRIARITLREDMVPESLKSEPIGGANRDNILHKDLGAVSRGGIRTMRVDSIKAISYTEEAS